MEWISVKERMPERETDVLIFGDGRLSLGYLLYNMDVFLCNDTSNESKTFNITHWMPLPAIPQINSTNELFGSKATIIGNLCYLDNGTCYDLNEYIEE
jgi:hypothetical protein